MSMTKTVIAVVISTSLGDISLELDKEKYEEFVEAWRKKISEEEQSEIAGGYGDMREIVDLVVLRKVNFK